MRSNDKSFGENLDTVSLLAAYGHVLRIAAVGYRDCVRRLVKAKTHPFRKKMTTFVDKIKSLNDEAALLAYTYPSSPRLLRDDSMFSDNVSKEFEDNIRLLVEQEACRLCREELLAAPYKQGYYDACAKTEGGDADYE